MDKAVELIRRFIELEIRVPNECVRLHKFASGEEVSTWIVPPKWSLKGFSLEEITPRGRRVVTDNSDISLAVAEYSHAIDEELSWEEIKPHLFFSERQPDAIPFVFKYFYRRNYGFCLPKTTYDGLDRKARFRAIIDSEFSDGTLSCLEVIIPGREDGDIVVMSNICHPYQCNDSLTGAINNLMLIEHYLKTPPRHTMRFGFWPETIGAIAYFHKHYGEIERFRFGIFTEMLGTPGQHALQWSRQENSVIDLAARLVLDRELGGDYRSGRFTTVLRNDERISNGVNLDIPTISLSRYPYPEYHTSNDNPSIIDMACLKESHDLTRNILDAVDRDRILTAADGVIGQPFLTRYDLFSDPKQAGGKAMNNKIMEDVFSYSDGKTSLTEIAARFGYDLEDVYYLAEGLERAGLFTSRLRKLN